MSSKSQSSYSSKRYNPSNNSQSAVSSSFANRSQRSQRLFEKKQGKVKNQKKQKHVKGTDKNKKAQELNLDQLKPQLFKLMKEKDDLEQQLNEINHDLKNEIIVLKSKNVQLKQENEQLRNSKTTSSPESSNQLFGIRSILPIIIICFGVFLIWRYAIENKYLSSPISGISGNVNQYQKLKFNFNQMLEPIVIQKYMLNENQNRRRINQYLNSVYKSKGTNLQSFINQIYNNHEHWNSLSSYVNSFKKMFDSDFSSWKGHFLIMNEELINMKSFIKFNWNHIGFLSWNKCNIDDGQWRLFVQNSHLHQNIQILSMTDNNIKTIKKGDFQNFKQLRQIKLEGNPLTQQSKVNFLAFIANNPNVKFSLVQQQKQSTGKKNYIPILKVTYSLLICILFLLIFI